MLKLIRHYPSTISKKKVYIVFDFLLETIIRQIGLFCPYTEKYYHCARQCFIKRCSKCGGNPVHGFKLIYRVLNLKKGEKVRNIFSEEMSDQSEEVLQYFN